MTTKKRLIAKKFARRAGAAALALSTFLLFGHSAESVPWGTGRKNNVAQSISYDVTAGQTIGAPNNVFQGDGRALNTKSGTSGLTIGFQGPGDLTFDQNKATGQGGALWIFSNSAAQKSSLNISIGGTLTFSNNKSTTMGGGAVYLMNSNAQFKAGSIDFSGNTARNVGGAIHIASAVTNNPVTLDLIASGDVLFRGNESSAAGQMAGSIYLRNGIGLVSGDTVTFTDNKAAGNGGVFYLLNANQTIRGVNVTFSGNRAGTNTGVLEGGSVSYVKGNDATSPASLTIEAAEDFLMTGNTTTSRGGIYLQDATLDIRAKNVFFENNKAGISGGAIYGYSGVVRIKADQTFRLSGNEAYEHDGVRDGAFAITGMNGYGQEALTIIAGDILVENNVNTRGYSAAINVQKGATLLSADNTIYFANNHSEEQHAPSLRVQDNTELRAGSSIIFEDNSGHPQPNGGGGSAILIGMLKEDDRHYEPYLNISAPEIIIRNNTIEQNNADSVNNDITVGGATPNRNQYMVLSLDANHVTFDNNHVLARTRAYGSAISEFLSGDVYISGKSIQFINNLAQTSADSAGPGGKSYLDGEFAGQTFTPGALGGAIYTRVGTVDLHAEDIEFANNKALSFTDAFGGAVTLVSTDENGTPAALNIKAVNTAVFANNTVSTDTTDDTYSSRGGAMYLRMGEVSVDAGTLVLEKNIAHAGTVTAEGGAIYVGQAHVNISADTLELVSNTAESGGNAARGGVLFNDQGNVTVTAADAKVRSNLASTSGDLGESRGGAFSIGGNVLWTTKGRSEFDGNAATGKTYAAGSAIYADGHVDFENGILIFENNVSTAEEGDAFGAVTVGGNLTITNREAGEETQFNNNQAKGWRAFGGAVALIGDGSAKVETRVNGFTGNKALATGADALGGAIYSSGNVSFTATEGLLMRDNSAETEATVDARALGGAVFAEGDIEIVIGREGSDASTEKGDAEIIADAIFTGNKAQLGGALYSRSGSITLRRLGEAGGVFDFATDTDDVFTREGDISVTGTLIAKPGVSLTAGSQFKMGAKSSLVVQGRTHADDAAPSHFAIFGGSAYDNVPKEEAVHFNKARLTLTNYDDLYAETGTENRFMADVAAVIYRDDPGLIANGEVSADITGRPFALDTKDYRNGRLYLHTAIAQEDPQTDAIKQELYGEDAKIYKLVLAYDRHTLIWRGFDKAKWNEGELANTVWVTAGDNEEDYFTPKKSDDGSEYIPDSFFRGDIVVFDGKDYDSLEYGSAKTGAAGKVWQVPLYAHAVSGDDQGPNISAARVYVTGGHYQFTNDQDPGGRLQTDRLFVLSKDTVAEFKLPVAAFEEVSVGEGATVSFEDLIALVETPVDIAGTMSVQHPVEGNYTVHGNGGLTLHDGSGIMRSLKLEGGSTLNVKTLGAYRVGGTFEAADNSRTIVTPAGNWAANNSEAYVLMGEGQASASIAVGAKLTINGITPNSTGKWTLLENFEKKVDGKGWNDIDAGTLTINGSTNWDGKLVKTGTETGDYVYEVKTDDDGRDYVLVISRYEKEEEKPEEKDNPVEKDNPGEKDNAGEKDNGGDGNKGGGSSTDSWTQPTTPARRGHTDSFHIASSVQNALSRAVIEPRANKHLWAHFWRETGRVYDDHDSLALKTRAYGVILGRDFSKDPKKTWGFAAHIGKGDTSGKGIWDGATSDTDFWGLMLYGRRDEKKWFFTGDASMNWLRTDYTEANGASANKGRSTMFSLGGRAYYKWIDNPQPGQISVHPFAGVRWNLFRQSAYSYDNGDVSRAWKSSQVHVPMGLKIEWGEMESKNGWHVKPTFEIGYTRTLGKRSVNTSLHQKGQSASLVGTPLSARDTFTAEFRYNARNKNDRFHWELNAGFRRSSNEKEFRAGTVLKWEL